MENPCEAGSVLASATLFPGAGEPVFLSICVHMVSDGPAMRSSRLGRCLSVRVPGQQLRMRRTYAISERTSGIGRRSSPPPTRDCYREELSRGQVRRLGTGEVLAPVRCVVGLTRTSREKGGNTNA
jgi:hypothetical protein